jgi:hypothetical protein
MRMMSSVAFEVAGRARSTWGSVVAAPPGVHSEARQTAQWPTSSVRPPMWIAPARVLWVAACPLAGVPLRGRRLRAA